MAETSLPITRTSGGTKQSSSPIKWDKVFTYAVLGFGVILMVFPFLWMVSSSLMSLSEVTFGRLLPSQPLFSNYAEAFQRANFGQFMWNSVRITAITLTGQLLVCIPAAYAFARMQFIGRNILFTMMLATMMIPEVARFIPNYLTVIWLGRLSDSLLGIPWVNNWPALTVPFMAVPFTIFLLRQFFMQLPEDLWDAARIDGAGHIRFLRSVVIPLSTAPIMTAITFGFIGSWNSLLWPLLLTQTDEWRPVAVGLTKFVNSDAPNELHLQMAASVLMIIPILTLYFFTQRQFTEGIATSGLKG
ncbi:MAG: carbohydrate ABC transporter permease [Chloroflexi bacterium]|nr:carbohydrate ABC transporter permease [Chloroflexota bacterium]MCC6892963.1 carbohydrate ABC transporter permease [Anaerolineae bacterium]